MKDFKFGTKIYSIRKYLGLSQKELAKMLGVTNKAISKWENGDAYPSIKQLIVLSDIFKVSIDELLKDDETNEKQIFKIVLTGGPCSGKSTAMKRIREEFTKLGYYVLVVPETATEFILGGIAPWTLGDYEKFQFLIMQLQLQKEELFLSGAKDVLNYDKVLIVCDRGVMDSRAYMTKLEFDNCVRKLQTTEVKLRDNYDAVFHLVTAAIGAREHYNHNNEARYETAEEAAENDKRVLSAWTGHPHLRVIDNSTDFEKKLDRLIEEISSFLSQPYEIERKFLIEYPNVKNLEKLENCRKVEIIQTYLKADNGSEIRIRQRGENGSFTYTKTTKKPVSDIKRLETEVKLTKDEYLKLLLEADTSLKQIRKTRYCLVYNNQYFEIDIFPFWKDKAIMEIELKDENQQIDFPKFIKIIKEVTGDKNYFNQKMAN